MAAAVVGASAAAEVVAAVLVAVGEGPSSQEELVPLREQTGGRSVGIASHVAACLPLQADGD